MQYETVHVRVDDATITAGDPWKVIDPVWWMANIYDGPDDYEMSLLQFSRSQRLVFALIWYQAEVNNGGHHQFYSNSTGIVWKDALEAFHCLDLPEFASILEQSASRFGGSPSLDHDERNQQLATFKPNFSDLDDRFYAAEKKTCLEDRVLTLMRARPGNFYFDGTLRRAVIGGSVGSSIIVGVRVSEQLP